MTAIELSFFTDFVKPKLFPNFKTFSPQNQDFFSTLIEFSTKLVFTTHPTAKRLFLIVVSVKRGETINFLFGYFFLLLRLFICICICNFIKVLLICKGTCFHFEQLNGFSSVWILSCFSRLPESLNALLHFEQWNGFSSEWILSCFFKWEVCLNFLSHINKTLILSICSHTLSS